MPRRSPLEHLLELVDKAKDIVTEVDGRALGGDTTVILDDELEDLKTHLGELEEGLRWRIEHAPRRPEGARWPKRKPKEELP